MISFSLFYDTTTNSCRKISTNPSTCEDPFRDKTNVTKSGQSRLHVLLIASQLRLALLVNCSLAVTIHIPKKINRLRASHNIKRTRRAEYDL